MHAGSEKMAVMRFFSRPHIFLFSLGLLTLATQVAMTRELLGNFGGSELILAIFYAAWLAGLGTGAYLGRRTRTHSRFIVPLSLGLIFAVPVSVAATRFMAIIPGVQSGVMLPWWSISLPVMGIVFPLAVIAGMLFPIATSFIGYSESETRSYGMSYMIEAAGSLCAGVMLSFWLLDRSNSFLVLLPFIGVFSLGFLFLIRRAGLYSGMRIRLVFAVSLIHAVIWPSLHPFLETFVWDKRIGDIPLIWSGPSKYGYYQIAYQDETIAVYLNSIPITACEPDPLDEIHADVFRLSAGSDPLIAISGNMRYASAFSSRDTTTRIIEQDKILIRLWNSFCSPVAAHVIQNDIRLWLSHTSEQFDLLLVDAPEPTTAQADRYYTKEFFESVQERLSASGVFILSAHLPASRVSGSGIEMAQIVYRTLISVFPSVLISPGPGGWFLASSDTNFTLKHLYERAAPSDSSGLLRAGLSMLFPVHATKDFERALKDESSPVNTDTHPRAYASQLRVALARMGLSPEFTSRFSHLLFVTFLLGLIVHFAGLCRLKNPVKRISLIIGHTGFVSFATSFLLLIGFQHTAGTLYNRIALLTGLYMAGLTMGAFWGSMYPVALGVVDRLLTVMLITFAFIVPAHATPLSYYILAFIFAGIVGMQLPGGVTRLIRLGKRGSYSAGLLDSADHIGAAAGAAIAGLVLLPVLGFRWAFILLGIMKILSACIPGLNHTSDVQGSIS